MLSVLISRSANSLRLEHQMSENTIESYSDSCPLEVHCSLAYSVLSEESLYGLR